ncbi:MAG: Histidinol-phosphate/aromatic aminotransferase and cobyric acid decarboxylase [Defluviitaleaceae bacterium]|nr:Histidinol-phosphate/aromatic aminotransferase and cobyric acid decarboxylase [Defluviitaleaceae bacterium]
MDFSININPLGMPEEVEAALHKAVKSCSQYPDIKAEKLKKALSSVLKVQETYLLFGNGASELFLGIVHAIKPKKTLIPIPSFYGYEYALEAVDSNIIYFQLKEDKSFLLDESFFEMLTEDIDLLFLANPNNPTGKLMAREYIKKLLDICKDRKIWVVLDECFIEFCENAFSILTEIDSYENLLLVRAFTKIYAIPGVRLGYLVCSNKGILEKIKKQLPEWNISTFAQEAGLACVNQPSFIAKTVDYVKKERQFLIYQLNQLEFKTFPSEANFILLYSEKPLYETLLKRGILIRDCENFRGLSKGYYRIAVKTRKENERLVKAISEVYGKE